MAPGSPLWWQKMAAAVPDVTTSLPVTSRGKKKASFFQIAQQNSCSDLLLLIMLILNFRTKYWASRWTYEWGWWGRVELPKRRSESSGQESQEMDTKYQQRWLGKVHHKVSEFKHCCLPVKSFSDSLGTWSLSVYLSVRLRDKPGVILGLSVICPQLLAQGLADSNHQINVCWSLGLLAPELWTVQEVLPFSDSVWSHDDAHAG